MLQCECGICRNAQEFEARGMQFTTFLISEVSPQRLAMIDGVDAWVQVSGGRGSGGWVGQLGAGR